VLDSGTGEAVGYIIGTPSTADFAQRWPLEFLPTADVSKIPIPPKDSKPTWKSDLPAKLLRLIYFDQTELLNGQWPKLWEEFPGHLHIDIKYRWTGQGYGQELIKVFVDHLKKEGARGVHLGMVATNDRASKFYERLEFNRFPEVLDEGKSGELGRTEGAIIRVKYL
jgi:GNAT superfamily N-acetyltransferase